MVVTLLRSPVVEPNITQPRGDFLATRWSTCLVGPVDHYIFAYCRTTIYLHIVEADVFLQAPYIILNTTLFYILCSYTHYIRVMEGQSVRQEQSQSDIQPRSLISNLKLSWASDFESLKSLVSDTLQVEGIWSSPGGEKKVFQGNDVKISWLKNKKFLTVQGNERSNMTCRLLKLIDNYEPERLNMNATYNTDGNSSCLYSCKCAELATDMEGVKLDLIILEAKMNQQTQAHREEMSKLREDLINSNLKINKAQCDNHQHFIVGQIPLQSPIEIMDNEQHLTESPKRDVYSLNLKDQEKCIQQEELSAEIIELNKGERTRCKFKDQMQEYKNKHISHWQATSSPTTLGSSHSLFITQDEETTLPNRRNEAVTVNEECTLPKRRNKDDNYSLFVVGDSTLKYVKPSKLSKAASCNVARKSIYNAKGEDIIRHSRKRIVPHKVNTTRQHGNKSPFRERPTNKIHLHMKQARMLDWRKYLHKVYQVTRS